MSGNLADVVERTRGWVKDALPGRVEVVFDAPSEGVAKKGVHLYLVGTTPVPLEHTRPPPPLKILLRYLVTTRAGDQAAADALLVTLLFAAMDEKELEMEVETKGLSVDDWVAFGVSPRPSFFLTVPVEQEREYTMARPVLTRNTQMKQRMRPLTGVVLGPKDVPIAGARVELPAFNRSTSTDPGGQFVIPGLPSDAQLDVRVTAKGKRCLFQVTQASAREPVRLDFPALEE
ncbi:MAG: carboxypeptidase-like regulatory domain-containing protein [Planctomycetota bacterium]|jgi:hypothetical protein